MTQRFTLSCFVLCLISYNFIGLQAQTARTITVEQAGTLASFIEAGQKYQIDQLTISGKLNGTDLKFLREMAGRDVNGEATEGQLATLDISQTDIQAGGAPYHQNYYSEDNTIGTYLFSQCNSLTRIVLPESVTRIGDAAFQNCTRLGSVVLPESLIKIGSFAFYECPALNDITMNRQLQKIGMGAFSSCTSLARVVLPESVTELEEAVFRGCEQLTEISIPQGINRIPNSMFSGAGLVSIVLPEQLDTIGRSAFNNCRQLTEVVLPNRLKYIADNAFSGNSSLKTIVIPGSVTTVDDGAFSYCEQLTVAIFESGDRLTTTGKTSIFNQTPLDSVYWDRDCYRTPFYQHPTLRVITVGNHVNELPENAFSGCSNLSRVIIEDGKNPLELPGWNHYAFRYSPVTDIYIGRNVDYLFSDIMSTLTTLTIGEYVTGIGSDGFSYCSKLTTVRSKTAQPLSVEFSSAIFPNCTLYVPAGAADAYRETYPWSNFHDIQEVAFPDSRPVYTIRQTHTAGGKVWLNETENNTLAIRMYEPLTVRILPDEGYRIASASLDGNDITPQLSGGQYTIAQVTRTHSFEIRFEPIPSYPVYIVYNPSGGKVKLGSTAIELLHCEPVTEGNDITLSLIPAKGFRCARLERNGTDITDDIARNSYTTTVTETLVLNVRFDKEPQVQEQYQLLISHAENGAVTIPVSKDEPLPIQITPTEGWLIHSVSFDGEEITDRLDADLNIELPIPESSFAMLFIALEQPGSIDGNAPVRIKVYGKENAIIIERPTGSETETIGIYDEAGTLLRTVCEKQERIIVPLPPQQLYLVRSGNQTVKVRL